MRAVLCPVCKGKGAVPSDDTAGEKTCHGCEGYGWVEISEEGGTLPWWVPFGEDEPYGTWSTPPWRGWGMASRGDTYQWTMEELSASGTFPVVVTEYTDLPLLLRMYLTW